MKARRYETLLLVNPELSAEELDQEKERYTSLIERMDGRIIRFEDWGRRRLAYPVEKQMYGVYHLLDFMGTPALEAELARNIGIDERIYKNMTLILDKDFSPEKYEQELERLKTEAEKREAEKAAREAERAARGAESDDGGPGEGGSRGFAPYEERGGQAGGRDEADEEDDYED
jgi:small subunit ribosomal protein S6